jgi:hypothetical protein
MGGKGSWMSLPPATLSAAASPYNHIDRGLNIDTVNFFPAGSGGPPHRLGPVSEDGKMDL